MRGFFIVILLLLSPCVVADTGCLPENDLRFPAGNFKALGQMTEFEANQLIERFQKTMSPIIKKKYKKKLLVDLDWAEDRVNAHATRDDNNNPVVVMLGGMVRHPEMTADALLTILCHELGHHYGGAPRKFRGRSQMRSWSSAEGQADYFATSKCLPYIFSDQTETKNLLATSNNEDYLASERRCEGDNVCIRIALASLSVGKLFASLKPFWQAPKISDEDRSEVGMTEYAHPRPQCRLDTFLAGALCEVSPEVGFDPDDPTVGACFRADNGHGSDIGLRPLCWYHPQQFFK